MQHAYVLINAGIYFYIGSLGLFDPARMADIVGLTIAKPLGSADIRATYGSAQLVTALLMVFIMYGMKDRSKAMLFISLIYAGFGSGRLIGCIANGGFDSMSAIFFAIEVAMVVSGLGLYVFA